MKTSRTLKQLNIKVLKYFLLKNNIVWQTPMRYLERERRFKFFPGAEYVRVSTLELLAHEIYSNKVNGNVAELGVYQGEFAKWINQAFPDRTLYLFDTFEGFSRDDIDIERIHGLSDGTQDFKFTSEELVIGKMNNPKFVVIKKGSFPQSFSGFNSDLAFVSIDFDLYAPTLEGLKCCYPLLSKGGYIMIHDFNNDQYRGVRKAVLEFCNSNSVPFFPLTDRCGSVIISKPF